MQKNPRKYVRITFILITFLFAGCKQNSVQSEQTELLTSQVENQRTPKISILEKTEEKEVSAQTEEKNSSHFSVSLDKQKGKYVLNKNNAQIEILPIIIPQNEEIQVGIFKETAKNIYIRSCRAVPLSQGYNIYSFCSKSQLIKFDIQNKKLTNLTPKSEFALMDISPDETMVAWADNSGNTPQIVIGKQDGSIVREISIDDKYLQFGDITFSPDSKKLAYAAAVGDPHEERGSVIVVEIKTGKETVIEQSKIAGFFHIKGWKDNENLDFSETNGILY